MADQPNVGEGHLVIKSPMTEEELDRVCELIMLLDRFDREDRARAAREKPDDARNC